MADFHENVIEWYSGEKTASVTAWNGSLKNKILKLANERPDEVQILAENEDGSILAHVPKKWVRITPSRKLTEEQREANAERLRDFRLNKNRT